MFCSDFVDWKRLAICRLCVFFFTQTKTALSVAVSELSKKQTAMFSHADEMPSGLSNSLDLLSPTEARICSVLATQKPGPELQRFLLYFLNLLKHLVSGYLKSDNGEKLGELVKVDCVYLFQKCLLVKSFGF
jgi:hypothetical protein